MDVARFCALWKRLESTCAYLERRNVVFQFLDLLLELINLLQSSSIGQCLIYRIDLLLTILHAFQPVPEASNDLIEETVCQPHRLDSAATK